MATYAFDMTHIVPPPYDENWRSPCGGFFDDLTYSYKLGALVDNDVIHGLIRVPPDESWLIHQMRLYNADGEPWDNASVEYRRPGREVELHGTGQWNLTTGPVTTYNLFFSSTGGTSVTWGLDSNNWKQPPYLGPNCIVLLQFYVNDAAGWAADNVASWQFLVDRMPEVGRTTLKPEEILARLSNMPMGGWFDR